MRFRTWHESCNIVTLHSMPLHIQMTIFIRQLSVSLLNVCFPAEREHVAAEFLSDEMRECTYDHELMGYA